MWESWFQNCETTSETLTSLLMFSKVKSKTTSAKTEKKVYPNWGRFFLTKVDCLRHEIV